LKIHLSAPPELGIPYIMLYTDVTQGINEIQLIARYILSAPPKLGSCENGLRYYKRKIGCWRLGPAYPDLPQWEWA
jgi:hypothetical protein